MCRSRIRNSGRDKVRVRIGMEPWRGTLPMCRSRIRDSGRDNWNSTLTIYGKKRMAPALRLLKDKCKEWSKEVVGNTCRKIKDLEMEAEFLESQKESRDLSSAELTKNDVISSNLRNLYRIQESAWHQKSRVQWCKFGDRNTRFFHLPATTRQKKN